MQRIITFLASLVLLLASSPVLATPQRAREADGARQTFRLPRQVSEVAPDVFALGRRTDPATGQSVDGFAFVHRDVRGGRARPGGGGQNRCYAFLGDGAKWKTIEPWVMNPANAAGLNSANVFVLEAASLEKWEDAADGAIGGGSVAIFGAGAETNAQLTADEASPDGTNEAYFADVDSPGAIAVTIVWGVFGGPPSQRRLVEWDQVYDDVDFPWSLDGAPNAMDFDNIATHEVGHAAGMGHPSNSCAEETMYAYADFGEIKKRDLNTGDRAGIDRLY